VEVVASLSQGRTAAPQCGLFTYKSVPVIFEPPCIISLHVYSYISTYCSYAVSDIDTHWTEKQFLVLFSVFTVLTKTFKYSTSIQVTVRSSFEK